MPYGGNDSVVVQVADLCLVGHQPPTGIRTTVRCCGNSWYSGCVAPAQPKSSRNRVALGSAFCFCPTWAGIQRALRSASAYLSGPLRATRNALEDCHVDQILLARGRTLVANQIRHADEGTLQVAADARHNLIWPGFPELYA